MFRWVTPKCKNIAIIKSNSKNGVFPLQRLSFAFINGHHEPYLPPGDGGAYRFEIGGGHWIFGGDPLILRFINGLAPVKSYQWHSAVYFPSQNHFVPYPLQNHLRYLGQRLVARVPEEIATGQRCQNEILTMADWLQASFGRTLCMKLTHSG